MRDSREGFFGFDGLKGVHISLSGIYRFINSISQPKVTAGASASTTTTAHPTQQVQPAQPTQPTTTEPAPQLPQPTTEQPPATAGPGSGFLTGPALATAIDGIVEMGFPREEVQRAMRASFNNPDRAVEYLMTVSRLDVLIFGYSSSGLGYPRPRPS